MPEPSDYWSTFQQRLTELGCEPVLIGALAALEYRLTPRFTTDVDFLVKSLDGVVAAFEAEGYAVHALAEPGGEPYVVFIRGNGAAVDALLVETDYQAAAHRRAVNRLLTVEDVIVHKLIAWRAKDQDDIASILAATPALDEPYIQRWATEWQVSDRWADSKQRWMRG